MILSSPLVCLALALPSFALSIRRDVASSNESSTQDAMSEYDPGSAITSYSPAPPGPPSKPPVSGKELIKELSKLNTTLGGRVIAVRPMGAECYTKFQDNLCPISANSTACAIARQGWTQYNDGPTFQPGGYVSPQWQGCQRREEYCILGFPDANQSVEKKTCFQGATPQAAVDVRQASDIVEAYAFSKRTGVPLIVKNTGHDFIGRSSAPNSLMLWTHNLKDMQHLKNYQPLGSSITVDAIKVGAGTQLGDMYRYAEAQGFTVIGGTSNGVGFSGGYLASGGHGFLSPVYGLAVDNCLENQDVFFAVVGGGPSSIGVLIESTHKVYPVIPNQVALVAFNCTSQDLTKEWVKLTVPLAKNLIAAGWGGGFSFTNIVNQTNGLALLNPRLSKEEAAQSIDPIFQWLKTLPAGTVLASDIIPQPSFYGAFSMFMSPATNEAAPVGQPVADGSRLLPSSLWDSKSSIAQTVTAVQNYLDALTPAQQTDPIPGALVQMGLVTPWSIQSDGKTSETPAWRGAVAHLLGQTAWSSDSTRAFRQSRIAAIDRAVQFLRDLVPNGGAYSNEAYIYEPNWENTFWGASNYKKLVATKAKYDPDSLLNCWHCVGFKPKDSRFSCYEPDVFQ